MVVSPSDRERTHHSIATVLDLHTRLFLEAFLAVPGWTTGTWMPHGGKIRNDGYNLLLHVTPSKLPMVHSFHNHSRRVFHIATGIGTRQ
jgi:hypothetical protein